MAGWPANRNSICQQFIVIQCSFIQRAQHVMIQLLVVCLFLFTFYPPPSPPFISLYVHFSHRIFDYYPRAHGNVFSSLANVSFVFVLVSACHCVCIHVYVCIFLLMFDVTNVNK